MSSDNGIYILKTLAVEPIIESDFEYRVIHAQSIENIYWDPEEGKERTDGKFTPEIAFEYFGTAPMFRTEAEALCYAEELAEEHYILEYGICSLDHKRQVFESFTDEEIQEFERNSDRLMEERRAQKEEELRKRTIKLAAHTYLDVLSGVVEIPSPDWDGDKPETQKMLRARLAGKMQVGTLNEVEVVVIE